MTPFDQLLESDPFEADTQSAKEAVIFLDSVIREDIINGSANNQNAEEEGRFFAWWRKPVLQISIMISLLLLVAIFSYRLGSQQPDVGDEPIPPFPNSLSPEALTQLPVTNEPRGIAAALPPPEDKHVTTAAANVPNANGKKANNPPGGKTKGAVASSPPPEDKRVTTAAANAPNANGKKANNPPGGKTKGAVASSPPPEDKRVTTAAANAPKANGKKANDPPVFEQSLIPPRLYRVTTPTVLRDQPKRTGKKVVRLKSGIKITVIAIAGDWLKVVSKANPPKPPGYVWKKDAAPEG